MAGLKLQIESIFILALDRVTRIRVVLALNWRWWLHKQQKCHDLEKNQQKRTIWFNETDWVKIFWWVDFYWIVYWKLPCKMFYSNLVHAQWISFGGCYHAVANRLCEWIVQWDYCIEMYDYHFRHSWSKYNWNPIWNRIWMHDYYLIK